MHAQVLYDEQDVVAAGAQNPWVRRRKIALADLMNEAWTLPPPDSLNGQLIVEAFRARRLDLPRMTVITLSVPVRNALLASGRFLSIVPGSVFRFPANNPGLKRLPIDLPATRTPVAVVTLKNCSGPDRLAPLFGLVGDELAEVGGRAGKCCGSQVSKACLRPGIGKACVDLLVEPVDDVGGGVLGRTNAAPPAGLVARHEFAYGRHIRQRLRACSCCHCQGAKGARFDVLHGRGQGFEQNLHLSAEQIGKCLRRTAIRDMDEVDTGHHFEQCAGEMLCGPVAGRPLADLARIGFRVGDKFGNRLRRKRSTYRHDVGKSRDAGNRRDVADEIETEFFVERRIDCVHCTAQQESVTVGGCANDRFGSQIAARARPVLDNDWLVELVRQPLTDQARNDVEIDRRPQSRRGCAPAAPDRLVHAAKRDAAGSAAAPAARCRNCRRGSFILPSQRRRAIRAWMLNV